MVCGCESQEKLSLTQSAPQEDALVGRNRPTTDTMKLFSEVTHGGLLLGYLDLRGNHRFALVDFPDKWQTGYLSSCSKSHIECGTGLWALGRGDDGWEISLHFARTCSQWLRREVLRQIRRSNQLEWTGTAIRNAALTVWSGFAEILPFGIDRRASRSVVTRSIYASQTTGISPTLAASGTADYG